MQKSLLRNAVAATMILLGSAAVAEAQTPAMSTPSPATAAAPANAAAPAAPAEPAAAPAVAATPPPAKVATAAKPHLSACARAILASERKLDRSSADSANIASAWQHIEEARKSRGQACREQARQAADLL